MTSQPISESNRLPEGERTRWLMQHENRLRLLARLEINRRFAGKFDPSDVVQQTLLEAWKGWDQLKSQDERPRIAWLRQILAHQIARFVRHHEGVQKRDLSRELSLEQTVGNSLEQSAQRLEGLLVAQGPSPSQAVMALEQQERLAQVLELLPEDYRQVILLRNFEDLAHDEIAKQMNRSEAAIRMLWLRALAALTSALTEKNA